MEKNYTYEVVDNGYYILVNGKKYIHQYENEKENNIPDKTKSYEENAIAQIEWLQEQDRLALEKANEITLEERVAIIEDLLIEQYESEMSNNG